MRRTIASLSTMSRFIGLANAAVGITCAAPTSAAHRTSSLLLPLAVTDAVTDAVAAAATAIAAGTELSGA